MRAAAAAVLALACAGCAFDAGEPYGLLSGSLSARYQVDADRDAEGGFAKLASDYQVVVTEAGLTVHALELLQGSLAGTAAFDPANPPAGYGACHGGHCHSADGRLVSYEEIEATLTGGVGSAVALSIPIGALNLLDVEPRPLTCDGGCALGAGEIVRLRLRVGALRLAGRVRDGAEPPRLDAERRFVADVTFGGDALPEVTLELPLELPLDDDSPSGITLEVDLAAGARLLDDASFGDLAGDPLLPIDLGADEEAAHDLTTRLGELELRAEVTRAEP